MTYPPSNKYFLEKKDFACTKCGQCCRPVVKVSDQEIQRIENRGLNDFFEWDEKIQNNVLKQKNGVCQFLKKEGEFFVCSIYDERPETCRSYPFIEGVTKIKDCRPRNWERWMKIENVVD